MLANLAQIFDRIQASSWAPLWLQSIRSQAFANFNRLGLPSRKSEDWKYTSVRPIAESGFEWTPATNDLTVGTIEEHYLADADILTFINGCYSAKHSKIRPQSGVLIIPMEEAIGSHAEYIQSQLTKTNAQAHGSFEELNLALFNGGAFVQIEPGFKAIRPLQLLHIFTKDVNAQLICPKNLVRVAQGAELQVIESYYSYEDAHLSNPTSHYILEKNAKLQLYFEKVLSAGSLHVGLSRIRVQRDAELECFTLTIGGKISRTEIIVELEESGAFAKLDGLYLGRQKSHFDHVTTINHLAPHSNSRQVYKGILYDESRAIFNGRINIVANAQQTAAHQLNKTLLMSEKAEIDTRPQLCIDADDVKCSHGATIGQLDPVQVFYLQSRGICKEEAETMLAQAFVRDLLLQIKDQAMHNRLSKVLGNYSGMVV